LKDYQHLKGITVNIDFKIKKTAALFIAISMQFFVLNSFAKVPAGWIQGDGASQFVATNNEAEEPTSLGPDLQKLLNTTYAVVSPSLEQKDQFGLTSLNQKKAPGPWYLASVKTEIGIEAGGDIGLVGVEGEAALEYIWMRTARSLKKLQQEHYGKTTPLIKSNSPQSNSFLATNAEDPTTLSLSNDMTNNEVTQRIDDLVKYIMQSKKVSNKASDSQKLRYQLTQHVSLHQRLAEKISESSQQLTWKPYKYQLELYVRANGSVIPTIEVGGVMRVRIEWSIREKKSFVSNPTAFTNHIEMLTNELSAQFQNPDAPNNQYPLYGVKVGLGFGIGGDLNLVSANAHAIASVFLKYNPPKANLFSKSSLRFSNSQDEMINGISRTQWQKGIKKASKMASYIISQSTASEKKIDEQRPQRDFELGAIEVELELTVGGEIFLPTVEGIGFMELFFSKKNRLKP
jgi:hypothetical protein